MLQSLRTKPTWMQHYFLKKSETKASKNWGSLLAMIFYMKKWMKEKRGDAAHRAFKPGGAGYKRVSSEFDARVE